MSFGFGSTGFGANTQASPFGGGGQSQFGQQQQQQQQQTTPFGGGGFGQQPQGASTPFGGGQSTFGAPAAPAGGGFGASQAGGFGQPGSSAPFGGSAFGAKPATSSFGGFGQSSAPATSSFGSAPAAGGFGAPASTGFGQQPQTSTPFGGAAGGFGSTTTTTPFGGASSSFGQPQAQPAFGATAATTTRFGGGGSAFGSGATGGAFGQPAGGMQTARGTSGTAWRKTQEIDQSSTGARTTVYFNSITCMPEYVTKSVEELRWEDYEAGNKGGQQAGVAGQSGGMFGSQPAASTPFGGASQSPTTGAFGAPAQTSFGAPSTSSFGGGGTFGAAASTPTFGASSSPAFGTASTTAFGGGGAFGATSTPAFGAPSSTPAFGTSSAPAFGAPSSTPAFGAATAAPTSAFGGSAFGAPASTPAFGAPTSTPAFGATTSSPAFGAASSAPAFGSSTPAFGGGSAFGGASSTPAFGSSSTPAFGAAPAPASTPAFSFGGAAATPKPASFQFNSPAPATSTFGATPGFGGMSTPAFGGANSTPSFGGGGGLFGSTPGPSASQPAGQTFGGMGTSGLFGSSQQGAAGAQQAGAAHGAASPYGNMPDAPKVTPLPEYKLGLTQRILAPPSAGPPKPIALITPRSLTPHGGGKIRPRVSATATRMSKSPADFFASSTLHRTPGTKAVTPGGADGGLFVPRDDPRRLLIREELPLSSNAKSKAPGRTPTTGPALAPHLGRSNGTPSALNGLGDGFDGMPSSASPLTLKSLSPPNSTKDNLAILPRLKREGYSLEPSMKQLSAMAMDDPDSLAYVANFTVRKEGIGSVRWLDPVDLRNLDIDSIVVLAQGSVDVYPDDSEKPPVGRGLNCPAVITLNGVYKMDKATGKPTKDPELVEKYSKKLKSICARDSAKFISYDGETGVWKFEVEHFSRYGLDGSSDDEDDGNDGNDKIDEDNGGDEHHGAKAGVILGKDLADPPTAPSLRELGNSSQSDFSEISDDSADMQLGIKGRHTRPEVTVDVEVPPQAHGLVSPRWGTSSHTPTGFAGRTLPSPIGLHRQLQGDSGMFEDPEMDDDFAPISNWKLPGTGDTDGMQRGLAPATLPAKDRPGSYVPADLAHQVAVDTRNLADYGAFMHNAFRVGWSRGRLVAPRSSPMGRVTLTNPVGDTDDHEARLLVDQLMIHKENSFPVEGTPAHRAPRLQLQCGRSPELLRNLTMQYINSIDRYIERDEERDDTPAKLAQAEIWGLVSVLFSLVPAEEDPIADDASDASDPGSLASLAGMQRRARFSAWLKSVGSDGVRRQIDAIGGLPGKGNEEVLVRLSGHDLAGAVMTASSCGNVRLSTLLATAGSSTEAVNSVIEQLRVWKEEGYVEHIDEKMMEIYELLAGNVDPAMYIVAQDWKRSLGMHLWYARPNTDPISEAVQGYLAAVQAGNAPYPGPWHPVKPTPDARRPTDTAFEMIRMFCFSEEWESESEKAAASLGALPDLLCPLGTTPDVQRVDFYWHLQCVLEAIGVIPEVQMYASGSSEAALSDAVSRVVTSFISQLESVGGLVHWAIYVALHIRDDDYRDIVVNDLLSRYVEEWHSNETVVGFLVQELGVPVPMLEGAKALWAAHINDDELLLDALIESNDWKEAHDVFCRKIAPTWLLAQSPSGDLGVLHESLVGALEEFEQHADEIDANDWRIGGDMYLSSFRLQERLEHLDPDEMDRISIAELGQALDDAHDAISPSSGELEKAAYAYLAQKLARICGASGPPHGTGIRALRSASAASFVSAGATDLGAVYTNL